MEHAVKNKKPTPLHNANVETFRCRFYKEIENGDITLADEYPLSKEPQRIDIIIVKKNSGTTTEDNIGKIFRGHNIIEFKGPGDTLSLGVFVKVAYGYAGNYAYQENVKLTDMTATMICYRRPVKLLTALQKEFGYKILRKYDGIYYIVYEGVPAEKTLAIQIVLVPELPDKDMLKAMMPNCSTETAKETLRLIFSKNKHFKLECWKDVVFSINGETLSEEFEEMRKKRKTFQDYLVEKGLMAEYEQAWKQEARQEGRQEAIELLEKGYSLEEAKKQLQFA
jgi:hypothetical protein